MMSNSTSHADAFSNLLGEALRAGPGTPAWREVLQELGAQAAPPNEELQLLLRVREHLESGRSYRSVRAGPEFTRRLLSELETASAASPAGAGISFWLIAGLSLLSVAAIVALSVMVFRSSRGPESPSAAVPLLETAASEDFNGPMSSDWQSIGSFSLRADQSRLRPATRPTAGGLGGGIVWSREIAANEPFSISVTLHFGKYDDHLLAEVFVSDKRDFDPANSVSSHELVELVQGHEITLLNAHGEVLFHHLLPPDFRGALPVRLTMNGNHVTLDLQDRLAWSGSGDLDTAAPRYVGLRFLGGNPGGDSELAFSKLRINMRHDRAGN